MDYYSAVKNNKIVNFAGKWIARERGNKLKRNRGSSPRIHTVAGEGTPEQSVC